MATFSGDIKEQNPPDKPFHLRHEITAVLLIMLLSRLFFFGVSAFTLEVFPVEAGKPHQDAFPSHQLWSSFIRWDSYHLYDIALRGYQPDAQYRAAFFPLYPSVAQAIGNIVHSVWIAGLLVSQLSFFIGGVVTYGLARTFLTVSQARWALVYICFFPSAFFFSAWYTEALFFALASASLLLQIRGKTWLALLLGAFTLMTRPVGIALILALAFDNMRQWIKKKSFGWSEAAWTVLLLGAPAGLLIFYRIVSGDALQFLHTQDWWGHQLTDPFTSIIRSVYALATQADIFGRGELFVSTMVSIPIFVFAGYMLRDKRVPFVLSIYVISVLVIPMFGGHLYSFSRYIVLAFPLAFFVVLLIRRAWQRWSVALAFISLAGLVTFLFTHWHWAG